MDLKQNEGPTLLGRTRTPRSVAQTGGCGLLLAGLVSGACGGTTPSDMGSGGGASTGGQPATGGAAAGGGALGSGGAGGGAGGGTTASGGSGGTATGGGGNFEPAFILGADISSAQESSATYVDTDGQTKSLFAVLQNHGFNYVRLRTFVDPTAPGGYASMDNGCAGKPESFGDKEHVIAYGKQAKDAGMGFLLDFHYSDTWADPGNQLIPASWRDATTTEELASRLADYTMDVLEDAIAAGARPDMVQIGNEITPGMVAHLPGPSTDCWGNNPGSTSPIGGSNSSSAAWDRLATLLEAGIDAVRAVDPTIKVMLHIENTDDLDGVQWWVSSAVQRGVDFDVLGLSCYEAFQGPPSTWQATFAQMASDYPDLEFAIAEYNPERTQANLIMKNLAGGRGLGTFFWEPTLSGEWGPSLFEWQGNTQVALPDAFAEYDDLLDDLGLD